METFKDDNGVEWTISVDLDSIDRVREETQIDLMEAGLSGNQENPADTVEAKLATDQRLMAKVIWYLLSPPPAEPEDPEKWAAFVAGMRGLAFTNARLALWADLVSFTQSPQQELRAATLKKMGIWLEAGAIKAREQVEDPRIDALLESELEKLGEKFGALLEGLASGHKVESPPGR